MYSNGFDPTKVLPVLSNRLGWKGLGDTPASGRFFDDGSFHSLLTIDNIKSVVPAQTDYLQYYTDLKSAIVQKCLSAVFNTAEFLEQSFVYDRQWEQEAPVIHSGRAVGFEINTAQSFDVTVQINSLQLYFDAVATFNVYLYKQGSRLPLKTVSVTTVAGEKTNVTLTDWQLNYSQSGKYYVVYFEDEVVNAKAIQELNIIYKRSNYYGALAMTATTTGHDFNRVAPFYNFMPFGLNLQLSAFRDYTTDILNQPFLFDQALGLTMACKVLEDIIYSTKSNANERILKDTMAANGLQLELLGTLPAADAPKMLGLRAKTEAELKKIKNSFFPDLTVTHKTKAVSVYVAQ